MSAVAVLPVASRSSVVRCAPCGVSRPAGHVHCYACGRKLGVPLKKVPAWGGLMRSAGWVRGRVERLVRKAPPRAAVAGAGIGAPVGPTPLVLMPMPSRPLEARTWGDRAARWYAALSALGVAAWLLVGRPVTVPAACTPGAATSNQACTWLDTQRTQVLGEVGKVAEAQRPVVAARLADLAALVGSGGRTG